MPIRLTSPPPQRFDHDDLLLSDTRKPRHSLSHGAPAGKVLLFSVIAWLLSVACCRHALWNNPHSIFFNGDKAYEYRYTDTRMNEGRRWIAAASEGELSFNRSSSNHAAICAGMVTVKRKQVQYLNDTVGSMLADLTPEERSVIDVRLLFADMTAEIHPDWNDTWLQSLDWWGTYNVSDEQREILQSYKDNGRIRAKGIFDYTYMMEQCYNTSAPYIAIFEDDVVFAEGWVAKTLDALATVRQNTNWLYVRLFTTEIWFAWDKAVDLWYENPIFQFVMTMAACYGIALGIILIRWRSGSLKGNRAGCTPSLVLLCLTMPAFLTLLFVTKPFASNMANGVTRMDKKGCCTQALVFPREQIPPLVKWLREVQPDPTDLLIERYADETGYGRYALAPSLVQHIGLVSTRGLPKKYAQQTWAFQFEAQDADKLRREHEQLSRWGIWRAEQDYDTLI